MGALNSRREARVEEVDMPTNNAYKYPPKVGNYFGSHFIMGGERFDVMQPEAYLFGESTDLNFLGSKPIPFPYPAPQPGEPTKTLRSLVNIRKDSLRLIRVTEDGVEASEKGSIGGSSAPSLAEGSDGRKEDGTNSEECAGSPKYNIEFTFDSDVKCAVTVYHFATEEITNGQAVYYPRDPSMNSETFHYKRGANQVFSQSTHIIQPSAFPEEDWQYVPEKDIIPIVIHCVVEDEDHIGHAHVTFAVLEKTCDGYVIKTLKQKQMVDGLCYLLQEIYGIENKTTRSKLETEEEDWEDNGSECVICMSDMRDTLILPCRHLCLCNNCADSLRYQANNCPICRAPFRALLQIRALRKKHSGCHAQSQESEEFPVSQEGVPPGYEAINLLEALNGPLNGPIVSTEEPGSTMGATAGPPPPVFGSPPLATAMNEKREHSKRRVSEGIDHETLLEESETEATKGDPEEVHRGGTPEVVLMVDLPEPVKPPAAEGRKKKRSSKEKKKVSPTIPDMPRTKQDSLEVVDETLKEETGLKEEPQSPPLGAAIGEESEEKDGNSNPQTQDSNASTPEDTEYPEEVGAAKELSSTVNVIPDQDENVFEDNEDQTLVVHDGALVEPLSLPGTPCVTDDSSYGSTSSSKALITGSQREDREKSC
ncbi:E3 ubiquitin-protein ligase MGRN1 isoform X2 [Lingula anatina]|uniref:RING-type E3 ubiquitin transferase n=1 Tax=Lingula anatina TaxID=7574 RepID=A0A1S3IDJ2_LINAN|nr:E3 ubiquitin-protein ligase MGRN1 isoform X2 [Lingula anatina]|eukprot:XP_013395504.1 E3 ubiquitin-protein ligase MGRN1 isoform X2 [Lingula anatina]